jgi:hypothetical protein
LISDISYSETKVKNIILQKKCRNGKMSLSLQQRIDYCYEKDCDIFIRLLVDFRAIPSSGD